MYRRIKKLNSLHLEQGNNVTSTLPLEALLRHTYAFFFVEAIRIMSSFLNTGAAIVILNVAI